jgi:tRNA-specific 2-thiouridylase
LLDYMRRLGGAYLASGHYARIDRNGRARLLKGADQSKDQSYFLHAVAQSALESSLFPIGDLSKDEVRGLANASGLPVHDKPDSTGICFIGERPFREFLSRFLPEDPGDAETPEGIVVGKHCGLMYYTLGQRQGLGIGGRADSGSEPWYVAGKDEQRNVLIVVQGREHPRLWSSGLVASNLHWISGKPDTMRSDRALNCSVKTRYRQSDIDCRVYDSRDGLLQVEFATPQWAVTPGQYAVFYAGDECLGGGPIEASVHSPWVQSDRRTA